MIRGTALANFTSHSTARIVHVELGFVPDFAIVIDDLDGTNPNIRFWGNVGALPSWTAALALLLTGSSGIVTRDTTGIAVYEGGDSIATTETVASAPTHVNRAGTPATAGHVTAAGLTIPIDNQTNSGVNVVIAFRGDE